MKLRILIPSLFLVLAGMTAAQEGGAKGALGDGLARRVSAALDSLTPLADEQVTIDDLAEAVSRALAAIDPGRLKELNAERSRLESDEAEIRQLLEDLEKGIAQPWSMDAVLPSVDGIDPAQIEREEAVLIAQEAELFHLQREALARRILEEKDERDSRPTLLTRTLLTALSEFPPQQAVAAEPAPAHVTEYPDRLARALFRTGDFVGALLNFKRVPEEKLGDRERYEMARCLEETGDRTASIALLDQVIAAGGKEGDSFWVERAKALREVLSRSAAIDELTEKGKGRP